VTRPTFLYAHSSRDVHQRRPVAMLKPMALVVATLAIVPASLSAQTQTPVPGQVPGATPSTLGTIGLDGTVDKFYSATHEAIVKTAEGVRHLVHLNRHTVVHGAESAAHDTSGGLAEGSRVVVHYVAEGDKKTAVEIDRIGDGGLSLVEGTLLSVDRAAKTLTIHLADDSTMTLRLTDRAAAHVGKGIVRTDRVIVYYADESGERVAHFFKKAT
jgi:hypothetical protein